MQHRVAVRARVGLKAAVKVVEDVVGRIVHGPGLGRRVQQARRGVGLALPVACVVDAALVSVVRVYGRCPVEPGVKLDGQAAAVPRAVLRLREEVAVVQPFATHVGVISHLPGQPAVVVIVVYLAVKPALRAGAPYESGLSMGRVHSAVGALLVHCGVAVAYGERIVVLRINVFSRRAEGKPVGKILTVAHERTCISEGAKLYLRSHVRPQVGRRRLHRVD